MLLGSLFSGIGLFELGLLWSGLVSDVAWQVEIDPYCRSVLARHYPNTDRSVEDVRLANASNILPVDVICGGFPCQDVSGAGKGAGLAGERSGLWYEYLRIVGELRPRIAIVENVASGKKRWLCEVRSDLHALGYRTRALQISAADVGLPHRRERIFVVAYTERQGQPQPQGTVADERGRAKYGSREPLAHTAGPRRSRWRGYIGDNAGRPGSPIDADRTPQPGMGRDPHGLPDRVDRSPAGRGVEQHGWEPARTAANVRRRPARLKALGNGIVPQCVEAVGRAILDELGDSR